MICEHILVTVADVVDNGVAGIVAGAVVACNCIGAGNCTAVVLQIRHTVC